MQASDEESESDEEGNMDEITSLEKDASRILQKIDPKNKLVIPKIKESLQDPQPVEDLKAEEKSKRSKKKSKRLKKKYNS